MSFSNANNELAASDVLDKMHIDVTSYEDTQLPMNGCVFLISEMRNGIETPVYVGATMRHPIHRLRRMLFDAFSERESRRDQQLINGAFRNKRPESFSVTMLECNVAPDDLTRTAEFYCDKKHTRISDGGYNQPMSATRSKDFKRKGYATFKHNARHSKTIDDRMLNDIVNGLLAGKSYKDIINDCRLDDIVDEAYLKLINSGMVYYDYRLSYPLNKKSLIFNDSEGGDDVFLGVIKALQENVKSISEIAEEYGMSKETVTAINNGRKQYDNLYEKYGINVPIRSGRTMTVDDYCQLLLDFATSGKKFAELFTERFGHKTGAIQGLVGGTSIRYERLVYPLDRNADENRCIIENDGYIIARNDITFASRKGGRRHMYYVANDSFSTRS